MSIHPLSSKNKPLTKTISEPSTIENLPVNAKRTDHIFIETIGVQPIFFKKTSSYCNLKETTFNSTASKVMACSCCTWVTTFYLGFPPSHIFTYGLIPMVAIPGWCYE